MPAPNPVAFMVMPYGERDVVDPPKGAPGKSDFDALWERAYAPALRELGYVPVRADADLGGLIIKEMLERIVLAHLVLADITLPNANVFYEVGVRHAAERTGCVLVAADWSKQPFDLQQMPQLRVPLPEGTISDATADAIRHRLLQSVVVLRDGSSPVHDSVPGYPEEREPAADSSFADFVDQMAKFDGRVRAIRNAAPGQRKGLVSKLAEDVLAGGDIVPGVAVQVLLMVRDNVGWEETAAFANRLPASVSKQPIVQEQLNLALSKSGDHLESIAGLEALMELKGQTSERQGLIGGRYKKLLREAETEADKAHYRNLAIEHYQAGSDLDLNDYYPACNLPRLYRTRGNEGDEALAERSAAIAVAGVMRSLAMNPNDEWARPTLLGAGFDLGNVKEAKRLATEVERQGTELWKLDTTIADLADAIALQPDAGLRAELEAVLERLRGLLG